MNLFDIIMPYIIAGLSVGGQYALIAIGYTMVYGILRLINFAHGDVFMISGLVMIYVAAEVPLYISIPIVIAIIMVIGFTIERVAYKPLRNAPRMSVMISAIGVSYLLQNLALYLTGGLARRYPTIPWISDSIVFIGITTRRVTVITPFLVVAMVVVLVWLINHTKTGIAMRAVAKDFETSQLMGIKINSVISSTFAIGTFLAVAGSFLFFSNFPSVFPAAGAMPGLKAFVAAVFGGIGSIPGAVLGGLLIGVFESLIKGADIILGPAGFGIIRTPMELATFSDAFTFVLLVIVLIFKPTGLFGDKPTEKV
ncbi:MAG: branched-chain amino acid ABC transporter permease [Defluviitaleaceae bacterium]|nr:branched-chain amino acid ABC transporter permease [Defluviitaleaceae bacterium]MCL2836380.1 branched-chain amino acid ABC transporter permease [Defluviitaleaceae bacterium]